MKGTTEFLQSPVLPQQSLRLQTPQAGQNEPPWLDQGAKCVLIPGPDTDLPAWSHMRTQLADPAWTSGLRQTLWSPR